MSDQKDRLATIEELRVLMRSSESAEQVCARVDQDDQLDARSCEKREDSSESITDIECAREIALRRLSYRARTRGELREDLVRKKVSPAIADLLIQRLTAAGALDDLHFAQEWVRTRRSLKKLADSRLRQELLARHVDEDIIDSVLSGSVDHVAVAREYAQKRLQSMVGLDDAVITRRLMGQLQRRGHSPSLAWRAIEEALASRE